MQTWFMRTFRKYCDYSGRRQTMATGDGRNKLTDEQIRLETKAPVVLGGHRRLAAKAHEMGIEEGQNRVLYLLLCIGDENVAHDHWHPDKAQFLYETRLEIVKRLELDAPHYPSLGSHWPKEYPDFEKYTYRSG